MRTYKVAFIPHTVLASYVHVNTTKVLTELMVLTGASNAEYHVASIECECKQHFTLNPKRKVNHIVLTDPDMDYMKIKSELSNAPFAIAPVWNWWEGEEDKPSALPYSKEYGEIPADAGVIDFDF